VWWRREGGVEGRGEEFGVVEFDKSAGVIGAAGEVFVVFAEGGFVGGEEDGLTVPCAGGFEVA
jgi:hypothetical protein